MGILQVVNTTLEVLKLTQINLKSYTLIVCDSMLHVANTFIDARMSASRTLRVEYFATIMANITTRQYLPQVFIFLNH